MRLKSDIRGSFRPEVIYGKKGDEVKIISDCGNVFLVEGPDGNKFPVPADQLEENKIDKKNKAL